MKKRILSLLLFSIICTSMLAGCSQHGKTEKSGDTDMKVEDTETPESYDVLQGVTLSVIGDSYFGGNGLDDISQVWPSLLATKYGMEFNNYGMDGSTISNYAGDKFNPIVDRWTEIVDNDPDIILVEGGRNDYNQNVPLGELGSSDPATMKGAVTYLITNLQQKFPEALIIGVTCWEVGGIPNDQGYTCSEYGRALIEVCENLGIPYIDAMDSETMGVYMTDAGFRRQYCISYDDISHLNAEGMKLVLPAFENQIAKAYQQFLNNTESK